MEEQSILNEMEDLILKINHHNFLYYVEAKPEISDLEYDRLFDRLVFLEKKYSHLKKDYSPTGRVGSDTDNQFPEIAHTIPVLSLDKIYNASDLSKWLEKTQEKTDQKISFSIEPKIDGFSVALYYKNGVLSHIVSRGNGNTGNDLTENIKTIKSIPLKLLSPIDLAVRGEVYIEKEDFLKYNQKMGNVYANPRNFAAGSVRRNKSSEVGKIPLKILVYDGYSESFEAHSNEEMHSFLIQNLFPLNPEILFFNFENKEKVLTYLSEIEEKRKNLQFEIDGLVIKVNEYQYREELGYTAHHPRWAVAYKFEAPQNISKVMGIQINVGRTGRITPLALIEPVKIGGSTVSRATLHNQEYINSLELAVGDTVIVSKRGEIIPAIEEVVEKGEGEIFSLPDRCPECESKLMEKGAHLFCVNPFCKARMREKLAYFVQVMDIENFGKETVKLLFEKKIIENIPDIYYLKESHLINMEGFGDKKTQLILEGIKKSLENPYETVFTALGFDEIAVKVIQILSSNGLDSFEKIIDAAKKNDPEIFLKFHGIGKSTAESIIREFNDIKNINLIEEFEKIGLKTEDEKESRIKFSENLKNTVWCVTGSFENFKPREKALELILSHGGSVSESVTKRTTHLLKGEGGGSKNEKAAKLGIKIVSETEFLKMLSNQEEDLPQKENFFESLF
ncbi:MAG TPA: DNA ligase (NAD(+)) LigA [Spirochaetia bacterium]|nr:MAG: DNA ligase (NAD(+)) LigA [Spirochaetes bacterium GWB1_36_13]HCL55421.1 DNA ligase (NAD(+)) LigA [Spirochaetia bacterium]